MDPDLARCLELFHLHQRRLLLYLQALLPSPADADEALQEANIVIWKKFGEFAGGDFLSWALRIAHFQALEHRRRNAQRHPGFAPELLDQLALRAREESDLLERRRAALTGCTKKLDADDQGLVEACYAPGARIHDVAARLGRTATSLYRSLRRIRQLLQACVDRTLAREA